MKGREIKPGHDARGLRFCVVAARFNEGYVQRLASAALDVLSQRGAAGDDIEVWWVPGSFELPLASRWAANSARFDAVLAFGVLIRGETEHFRLVADAAARGLMEVALQTGTPVLNGVLATHDAGQAAARSGGDLGNRGAEVALAAIQMVQLRSIRESR